VRNCLLKAISICVSFTCLVLLGLEAHVGPLGERTKFGDWVIMTVGSKLDDWSFWLSSLRRLLVS